MRFLVSAALAILLALPVQARPLAEGEQADLMKAVGAYLRATGNGNAEKIVSTIPPRVQIGRAHV